MSATDGVHSPTILVVGGGISGLAAAEHIVRMHSSARVVLLEASHRLGGCIHTSLESGYVIEHGPDVFIASKRAAIELAERAGVAARLQSTDPAFAGAYIVDHGVLHRLPDGMSGLVPSRLASLLSSPLLSWRAKARVALEYFVPPYRGTGEESVESFVVRRLGREMYDRVVEPLLTGIYAGDGSLLSIEAAFPQLASAERERGGLIKGMRATKPIGGRTGFLSFPGGMSELVEGVERALVSSGRVAIAYGSAADRLVLRDAGGVSLSLRDGRALEGDAVVVATPAPVAARLLAPIDEELGAALRTIVLSSVVTVTLAYPSSAIPRPLDATGYLVPRRQRKNVLACTWSSAKFTGRAPAGKALIRVFMTGAVLDHADADLVVLAREELGDRIGVTVAPELTSVSRWPHSMPQYNLGHGDRVAFIEDRVSRIGSLALAGNAYLGVGIPDCITSGARAAAVVLRGAEHA